MAKVSSDEVEEGEISEDGENELQNTKNTLTALMVGDERGGRIDLRSWKNFPHQKFSTRSFATIDDVEDLIKIKFTNSIDFVLIFAIHWDIVEIDTSKESKKSKLKILKMKNDLDVNKIVDKMIYFNNKWSCMFNESCRFIWILPHPPDFVSFNEEIYRSIKIEYIANQTDKQAPSKYWYTVESIAKKIKDKSPSIFTFPLNEVLFFKNKDKVRSFNGLSIPVFPKGHLKDGYFLTQVTTMYFGTQMLQFFNKLQSQSQNKPIKELAPKKHTDKKKKEKSEKRNSRKEYMDLYLENPSLHPSYESIHESFIRHYRVKSETENPILMRKWKNYWERKIKKIFSDKWDTRIITKSKVDMQFNNKDTINYPQKKSNKHKKKKSKRRNHSSSSSLFSSDEDDHKKKIDSSLSVLKNPKPSYNVFDTDNSKDKNGSKTMINLTDKENPPNTTEHSENTCKPPNISNNISSVMKKSPDNYALEIVSDASSVMSVVNSPRFVFPDDLDSKLDALVESKTFKDGLDELEGLICSDSDEESTELQIDVPADISHDMASSSVLKTPTEKDIPVSLPSTPPPGLSAFSSPNSSVNVPGVSKNSLSKFNPIKELENSNNSSSNQSSLNNEITNTSSIHTGETIVKNNDIDLLYTLKMMYNVVGKKLGPLGDKLSQLYKLALHKQNIGEPVISIINSENTLLLHAAKEQFFSLLQIKSLTLIQKVCYQEIYNQLVSICDIYTTTKVNGFPRVNIQNLALATMGLKDASTMIAFIKKVAIYEGYSNVKEVQLMNIYMIIKQIHLKLLTNKEVLSQS